MIQEQLQGKKWGLVLNGGGGKGSYQIGVFQALREMGMTEQIAAVAGSSAGALNTCLWLFDDATCRAAWESISMEKLGSIDPSMIDGYEGMVSRDGLLELMNDYVNMETVSKSPIPLYVTLAEYDADGNGTPAARYETLNGKSPEEIRELLLITTCLPILYEPIRMNGKVYRDGGLADNMPVRSLYDMGLRNIIVVCTSTEMPDLSAYPDVEFLVIRPSKNIGELFTGTLDFSPKGVKVRVQLGYMDGMRNLKYYGNPYANLEEIAAVELRQLEAEIRQDVLTEQTDEHMEKLKSIYQKYGL
jgi:NTE family protein